LRGGFDADIRPQPFGQADSDRVQRVEFILGAPPRAARRGAVGENPLAAMVALAQVVWRKVRRQDGEKLRPTPAALLVRDPEVSKVCCGNALSF
jgi:hypothetical protein